MNKIQIFKGEKQTIDDYFQNESISQSRLKLLSISLDHYKNNINKVLDPEEKYILFGNAVDLLLTCGEEAFKSEYYVSRHTNNLSPAEKNILKNIYKKLYIEDKIDFSEYLYKELEKELKTNTWNSGWKLETRVKKIIDKGNIYFKELISSEGRQIISEEDYEKINKLAYSLKEDLRTRRFFNGEFDTDLQVEIHFQYPIYFNFQEKKCKGLLDILIIKKDEKGNIVEVQGIDIKTSHDIPINFPKTAIKFRYDIQAAWYSIGIQNAFGEHHPNILPFTFIVKTTSDEEHRPVIFETSEEFIDKGLNGINTVYTKIKGIYQLMDDYKFYSKDGFDEERVIRENFGCLKL